MKGKACARNAIGWIWRVYVTLNLELVVLDASDADELGLEDCLLSVIQSVRLK